MGVAYVSQRFTLEFGNVPGEKVGDLIDAFSPGARKGGPNRPPSIVNFEVQDNELEEGAEGEKITLTFTYQCYCGGSGKAMIYRFADAALRKTKLDGTVSRNVIPGEILEKRPPKDAIVQTPEDAKSEPATDVENDLEIEDSEDEDDDLEDEDEDEEDSDSEDDDDLEDEDEDDE